MHQHNFQYYLNEEPKNNFKILQLFSNKLINVLHLTFPNFQSHKLRSLYLFILITYSIKFARNGSLKI